MKEVGHISCIKNSKSQIRFEFRYFMKTFHTSIWMNTCEQRLWQQQLLSSVMFHFAAEWWQQCMSPHVQPYKWKTKCHLHPYCIQILVSMVQESASLSEEKHFSNGVKTVQGDCSSRFVFQLQLQQAAQTKPPFPSAFSDFGSKCRVLLSNGLVVIQNPLQVSHSFVSMFCLNLWTI